MRRRRFEPEHMGTKLQAVFLDDYELTPVQFASAIRVPLERVERVLSGLEPFDADLALRMAKLFGGSGDGWLSWQMDYDLWHAHERIVEELDAIVPLDPDTRASVREDEPLEPEFVEELRRRMDDVRDPRRWVVVSRILDEDVPLHEESISRTFYDVESNCYCADLRGATPFKSESVARAVADAIGERQGVVQITTQDLETPRRSDAVDRGVRDCCFRSSGQGMSDRDVGIYLRGESDMATYLEAASEYGDPESIAAAVADVMQAMKAQTTVEYLEARGELGSPGA
jgi:addiction module HigA family antidote